LWVDNSPGQRRLARRPANDLGVPPSVRFTEPLPTLTIGYLPVQKEDVQLIESGRVVTSMPYIYPQPEGSYIETGPRLVDPRVKVTLSVTDRGAGVSSCKLFRNRHLIHTFSGLPRAKISELSWDAEMLPGNVEFSAYCFDRYGNRSIVDRTVVIGDQKLKGTRRAFVIAVGINDYVRSGLHLSFAESDAQLVSKTLYSELRRTGDFDQVVPVDLLSSEGTAENIIAALQLLSGTYHGNPSLLPIQIRNLPSASAHDTVFFYFAGHGAKVGSRYILLAHNFQFDLTSRHWSGAVSDLTLATNLESLRADKVVVIIDACESGAALDPGNGRVGPFDFKSFAQMAYDKGIFVIAATQSSVAAREVASLCHGQFTYILVKDGLVSYLADWRPVDGKISVKEWLQYGAEHKHPLTPNKECAQPTPPPKILGENAKPIESAKSLWEQVPRLFLPDVYSGFDFMVSKVSAPAKR